MTTFTSVTPNLIVRDIAASTVPGIRESEGVDLGLCSECMNSADMNIIEII